MDNLVVLVIGLVVTVGVYWVYRHSFLKPPKNTSPSKPHFTLKIETD